MDDQTPPQNPAPEQQQEKKPERVDELDVIGGTLLRFIQNGFHAIKRRLSPAKE